MARPAEQKLPSMFENIFPKKNKNSSCDRHHLRYDIDDISDWDIFYLSTFVFGLNIFSKLLLVNFAISGALIGQTRVESETRDPNL